MWATIGIATLAVISFALYKLLAKPPPKYVTNISDSWAFRPPTGPAIGHLGGVPVFIPRAYANLMEYDGDPHFLEQRTEPPPQRSYQSGIASFAFDLDFPSMKVREFLTHSSRTPEERMNLLHVGISSNSDYGSKGDEFLESLLSLSIYDEHPYPFAFKQLPNLTFGLISFAPIGVNLANRKAGHPDYGDRNIHFQRNSSQQVAIYIRCDNSPRLTSSCDMRFNMNPQLRAHVSVSFNKTLLRHWSTIRFSVAKKILEFRTNPAISSSSK